MAPLDGKLSQLLSKHNGFLMAPPVLPASAHDAYLNQGVEAAALGAWRGPRLARLARLARVWIAAADNVDDSIFSIV